MLGRFAKAGRDLGISAVAVSQNVSWLKKRLGVRLQARSPSLREPCAC